MTETSASWIAKLTASGLVQEQALSELRAVLFARLSKTLMGRAGVDESLLDDVIQEALVKTLNSLDQFEGRSRFTTWATTIAVRVAFTELRRRHWRDVSLDQFLHRSQSDHELFVEPDGKTGRNALVQAMYEVIETQLTEKQRQALLAELQGMPLEEIGRRMGSNRNAIYKLTYDARRQLKRHLDAAGYTLADLQTS